MMLLLKVLAVWLGIMVIVCAYLTARWAWRSFWWVLAGDR